MNVQPVLAARLDSYALKAGSTKDYPSWHTCSATGSLHTDRKTRVCFLRAPRDATYSPKPEPLNLKPKA